MRVIRRRDLVAELAPTDPEIALSLGRTIRLPWLRAQALAWVSRFVDDDRVLSLAHESLAVARDCEPRRGVPAAAWPIRALLERGHVAEATACLKDFLVHTKEIVPATARADALYLLFVSAVGGQVALDSPAVAELGEALVRECTELDTWRARRNMRDVVAASMLPPMASHGTRLSGALPAGVRHRFGRQRDDAAVERVTRPFFPVQPDSPRVEWWR